MSRVLVISTSLRGGSFSEKLATSFAEGAREAGHDVEFVSLKGKKIQFCKGCVMCQNTKRCIINDSATAIVEKIRTSDIVVWATPVYYYSMSGQMKVLIDRCNPIYVSDYSIKDVYLLVTCADESETAIEGTLKGVQGWVDCLPGTRIAGTLCATGLPVDKRIEDTGFLEKAYGMGKSI